MQIVYLVFKVFCISLLFALSGCGGGGSSGASRYPVTVEVNGLRGNGLEISLFDHEVSSQMVVDENGQYTFPKAIRNEDAFGVRVTKAPSVDEVCTVYPFNGIIIGASPDLIGINCHSPWVWVAGPKVGEPAKRFGIKGVASESNTPGVVFGSAAWVGLDGRLWQFGGQFDVSEYNALWVFDPESFLWTWVAGPAEGNSPGVYVSKGQSSPTATPSARNSMLTWTDENGRFWLYSGLGYDKSGEFGRLDDLWMFDPDSMQWTWVFGSGDVDQPANYGELGLTSLSNHPGGLQGSATWVDGDGDLWLFGGGSNLSNNLWEFDAAASEWIWWGGGKDESPSGVYGELGVPASSNAPGARWYLFSWVDSQGKFWIWGGSGFDSEIGAIEDRLQDLWRYDPDTKLWTWMGGPSRTYDNRFERGAAGVASAEVVPNPRSGGYSWVGKDGDFYLYGGAGEARFDDGGFSDVWKYHIDIGQWSYQGGSNILDVYTYFGEKGVGSSETTPGARSESSSVWVTEDGQIWLYGGIGFSSEGHRAEFSDMWRR